MPDAKGPPESAGQLIVHGSSASYYTGKLEAYLRAKGIAHRLEPFSRAGMRRCARATGVVQIPQVECPDGSWLVDTSLIIEYFERIRPEPALSPIVPEVRFASRLLEDFADEWLWRPAMHYRWSFPENARLMSAWLAEHVADQPGPAWAKRRYWRWRQLGTFVRGDGVTRETRPVVEAAYHEMLERLEPVFRRRSYLMGGRPVEADFGFFAPFFRHFACDPVPGRIMRDRAPAVHEWVARMWNGWPDRVEAGAPPVGIEPDLAPIFEIVARDYLPYLDANASAHARGERRLVHRIGGVRFEEPVKPYRVWCRDRLHGELLTLPATARERIASLLGASVVESLERPSPRPVDPGIAALPIRPEPRRAPALDSWWRR